MAQRDVAEFVRSWLPPSPARVLEIGCGEGDLARALADAGYEVTAIDPNAPEGLIFRRVSLEEFAEEGPFDAAVASLALHHIGDLTAALDKIAGLLRPPGVLILDEFARDRLDGRTARWYYHQRQAAAAAAADATPLPPFDEWWREWLHEHGDIHPHDVMRPALARRFDERFFAWVPYLSSYRLDGALEPLERELIAAGSIQATGYRYVGTRRERRSGD